MSAIKVDRIDSIDGVLTYQNRTDWQNIFRTERDLYTFDGVAVVYNDSHYYIGDFQDKDRSNYDLVKKEMKPAIAKMAPMSEEIGDLGHQIKPKVELFEIAGVEKSLDSKNQPIEHGDAIAESDETVQEDNQESMLMCQDCPYQKKRNEKNDKADAFEEMIEKYPKLPMYGATELFDCVRIHPRDIGKLDMRNWKLGVNSFLSHGFYTYQYLLLGKLRFEDGTYQSVLGVPGVYSNRERYMANMFGFDQFIPVKQTNVKTGEFGYWIVEIIPTL